MHPMVLLGILLSCLVFCSKLVLEMLDRLQKKYVGLLVLHLLSFLEHLAHCQNIASLYLLVITLLDVHLNWLNWFHFSILERDLFVILIDCTNFLSPFLDVMSISMSPDSFLHSQTLEFSANRMFFWAMIYMALSPELKAPFICRFFLNRFLVCFNLFVLLFVVTPSLVVAVQLCMEWITINDNKEVLYLNLNLDPFFSYFI